MEVIFKTEFDILLIMKYGYEAPKDKEGYNWMKKEHADFVTNRKVEFHLLSVLPPQEVNHIGAYESAKELWGEFLELHERTLEVKLVRRDLLRN